MLMPISPEFVALCRSQVSLLVQSLGASVGAVYLREESSEGEEVRLVPIVAYPETATTWSVDRQSLRLSSAGAEPSRDRQLQAELDERLPQPAPISAPAGSRPVPITARSPLVVTQDDPAAGNLSYTAPFAPQPAVLPLIHGDMVMGLLVTGRQDRPWDDQERSQLEQVANTLAIACILDQRSQWMSHNLHQHELSRDRQQDILHNLLHQFRNPLTAIRTFAKLLARRLSPEDANRASAVNIMRESERLQDFLQQFDEAIDLNELDLSPPLVAAAQATERDPQAQARLLLPATNGLTHQTLLLTPCSLRDILQPLLLSAEAIAQDRGLQLSDQLPNSALMVLGNEPALREVFSNLIDNALKYTPAGGAIAIMLQRDLTKHRLGIAIWDNGPGIPPEDLAHVFERHYRGVQAETEISGTGLGLAIAQDLVQQMQGTIEVLSPAPKEIAPLPTMGGLGTTFIVWLSELESERSSAESGDESSTPNRSP